MAQQRFMLPCLRSHYNLSGVPASRKSRRGVCLESIMLSSFTAHRAEVPPQAAGSRAKEDIGHEERNRAPASGRRAD